MEPGGDPFSKLRPVSFGIAAENLKIGSKVLEVTAVEWLPYLDGEIVSEPETVEDSGVDGSGQQYTAKVDTANSLSASWLPWGSNRFTPPNIRRGERVMLYRFADSDKYYWKELGLDDHLRRLETVVYVFSNTRDEATEILTPDNSYSIEVSTHTKQITLRTNKSDGEPFAYTFQFNTKVGCVTLADDDSNYIEFDSAERKITAMNKDGSYLTVDKRVIKGFAPDMIHLQSQDIQAHCDTMLIEASQTLTENVGQSITITTPHWTVNTPLMDNNAEVANFTGVVNIQKLLTLMGGIAAMPGTGGAAAQFSIPMNLTAPLDSSSTITASGIGLTIHKHIEEGDGAPVSPPIP